MMATLSGFTQINLDSSLLGYYPFAGNALDSSGNGHDGTVNGASLADDRFGNANSAYSFDGTDDYIALDTVLGNFGTGDFTISFWMKTDSSRIERFLNKRPACGFGDFWEIALHDGKIFTRGDEDPTSANLFSFGMTATVNDGQWHHIVSMRAGLNMTMYLDGTMDTMISTNIIFNPNNSDTLLIGDNVCIGVDGTEKYSGSLDEIRFYERVLSTDEIVSLYEEEEDTVAGIELTIETFSIDVFPNPFSEQCNIIIQAEHPLDVHIFCYDRLGRVVFGKQVHLVNGSNTIEIDARSLEAGLYFLHVNAEAGLDSRVKKVIILE